MPLIQVKVKPGARISQLTLLADGTYRADVKAPPTDGKANDELIRLVSQLFGCSRSAVTIRSGRTSRVKWVGVDA
ncbi:MAG: DUF167 domain-containing protein [Aphanothece saxicola GSE-SYN-MK-01-06B]|jgi:hypothetical protein|nr:DUF167 domain-containing protein [Aphanothece saxicola GSE-SYN-MK-01-06B]